MDTQVAIAVTESLSFDSVEQLDELTHALGWDTEYRQLQPGLFASHFSVLEGEQWFLMEEQSSNTVEVQAPAPDAMFVLAVVEGAPGAVNGQTLSSDHIFIQSPDSEFRATLPANIRATQIGVGAEHFESLIRAMAPDSSAPLLGKSTILVEPDTLTQVRQAMRAMLANPLQSKSHREAAISDILEEITIKLLDHCARPSRRELHPAMARRALDRALEYIETHLTGAIQIAAICRYAQITSRSLERIFLREFAMSPQQYVKARKLNAARRSLLAARRGEGIRVTDIAWNQGFTHMGRFSVDYRRIFGECPWDTLSSS